MPFGLMVFEEIRASGEFLVGFRCAVDEAMKDGLSQEECIEVAHIFERSGFIDFFNGNYGRMDTLLGRAVEWRPLSAGCRLRRAAPLPCDVVDY